MRVGGVVLRCLPSGLYSSAGTLTLRPVDLNRYSGCALSTSVPLQDNNETKTDTQLLSRVWARFRAYPNDRLPADQQEFWISRDKYLQREGVKKLNVAKGNDFVFLKPVALTRWLEVILRRIGVFILERMFRSQLPKRSDVMKASHQTFSIIMDAIRKDDLDLLRRRGLCTEPSRLQYQRDALSKLTAKQMKLFEVTSNDLVGRDGVLRVFHDHPFHNMRIISSINDDSGRSNYLLYGVMLVALYKKKLLFNAVSNHPLPSSYEWGAQERMVLKMPPGYGFLQRKHLVLYLEFAQPLNIDTRKVEDDVTLFDFHLASF